MALYKQFYFFFSAFVSEKVHTSIIQPYILKAANSPLKDFSSYDNT